MSWGLSLSVCWCFPFTSPRFSLPKSLGMGLNIPSSFGRWLLICHPRSARVTLKDSTGYIQEHDIIGFRDSFLPNLSEQMSSRAPGNGLFFESRSGKYFGLHFWFYSAVCVPIKWMLQLLQGNELKAFQLTNAVLLVLGLVYLFFASSLSMESRFAIALYILWCRDVILPSLVTSRDLFRSRMSRGVSCVS